MPQWFAWGLGMPRYVVAGFAAVVLVACRGAAGADPASTQIARGGATFATQCAACHGANLDGGRGPPLHGTTFLTEWKQKTARNLYSRILTTMPVSAPGSLDPDVVLELTMYLLHQNGVAVGTQAKASADELNTMPITH